MEAVIEAVNGTDERLIYEGSDMLYHLIVLLTSKGLRIEQMAAELQARHKQGGKNTNLLKETYMRIEYQNVDIVQEEHVILKGVNFQAEAGEFIYLTGKVGTGKSSLLKTFYGELDVHTGSARVLDREMTKIKRRHIPALRKRLGIVFQDFQLLNDRTVRANLDFVLKATGWKKKKERNMRIHEVLEQVGMTAKADQMPYQLSGGEQQCVCIARAILNRPDIILADEATGNLDKENGRRATAILYDISKAGTTVVLSTHNEELISEFPGVVYRCGEGRLQECTDTYTPLLAPDAIESKSIEENINENN